MNNIIKVKPVREYGELLEDELKSILQKHEKFEIKEFVVCYITQKPSEEREFRNYWFGSSSFLCLGMVSRMKNIISDWIRERTEYREED